MARVLVAAGGTGGHVYPALATAVVLRGRGHDVGFVGGHRIEARLVPEAGFKLHAMPSRGLARSGRGVALVPAIGTGVIALRSLFAARSILRSARPDVVLGMGGYVTTPPAWAAGLRRTPLVLHEQNAKLTLAIRLSMRWARVLALSLPVDEELPSKLRTEVTGVPLRQAIADLAACDESARASRRVSAAARFGLDPQRRTVLVFGGSLGSRALNEAVPAAFETVREVQVLHVAGPEHDASVRRRWGSTGVGAVVVSYVEQMEDAYAVADLVVSRSGATTVAELAALGLPSILIPLTQGRYQDSNARAMRDRGAARRLVEDELDKLGAEIDGVLSDDGLRARMSTAALTLARPDAAERLADIVESVI